MLERLKKILYNITGKSPKKVQPIPPKKKKEWVECIACGYRGSLDEFLSEDSSDTTCPKCGEDFQYFEI